MKYVLSLTAAALASAAIIAVAAPQGAGGHRQGAMLERIKAADTNGDGLISRDEAQALPMLAKHFNEIDTDGNGQLSPDELRAFHEKMQAQRFAEHFRKIDTDGDGRISLAERRRTRRAWPSISARSTPTAMASSLPRR
jgi:hypothetical protein